MINSRFRIRIFGKLEESSIQEYVGAEARVPSLQGGRSGQEEEGQ